MWIKINRRRDENLAYYKIDEKSELDILLSLLTFI